MTEFDPTTVPPFPIYTLELHDSGGVIFNGAPLELVGDESPTAQGTAAAAAAAAADGLDAVRVRAVSEGNTSTIVVRSNGDVYEIAAPKQPNNRTKVIAIVSVCVVAVGLLGGVGAFAVKSLLPAPTATPTATAAPTPPGAGTNVPVPAPPGYSSIAAWAIPISKNAAPTFIPNEGIGVTDDDGKYSIRDTTTGRVKKKLPGSAPKTPALTTIDGHLVIATASTNSLTIWPLDRPSPTPSINVPLSASKATVTFNGSAPLIDLGDQTVQFLGPKGSVRIDVPVTAKPLLATDTYVVAASGTKWWTIDATNTAKLNDLPRPDNAGDLVSIVAADHNTLIATWKTENGRIIGLIDLAHNKLVAQQGTKSGSTIDPKTIVRDPNGTTLASGRYFIDYGAAPRIIELPELKVSAIDGDTVYGTQRNEPAVAELKDNAFTTKAFVDTKTGAPAPEYVTNEFAYVTAKKVDTTYLYALPKTKDAQ